MRGEVASLHPELVAFGMGPPPPSLFSAPRRFHLISGFHMLLSNDYLPIGWLLVSFWLCRV